MKCMSMPLEEYFAKANSLMEKNSPLSFDTEIINRLKKLGVGPGLDLKQIENGAEMFAKIKASFKADAGEFYQMENNYLDEAVNVLKNI